MKKILTVFLAGAILLSTAAPAFAAQPKPVPVTVQTTVAKAEAGDSTVIPNSAAGIPDKVLYDAVKAAAKVDSNANLTIGDAKEITALSLSPEPQVKSLRGISYCFNLISLEDKVDSENQSVAGDNANVLEDLGDISALTKLQTLEISGYPLGISSANKLQNISALSGLTSLRHLSICNEQLKDISPLKNLTGLQTLELSGNQIDDLTPLKDMTVLQTLDLSNNRINDLTSLEKLTALVSLNLKDNMPQSFAPLAVLTNLTTLNISDDRQWDVSPLVKLTKLRELDASMNDLTSTETFPQMPALEKLTLTNNCIQDAFPLASMTSLKDLDLTGNKLTDITPFAALKKTLHTLSVSDNEIDITPEALDQILPEAMKSSMMAADYQKLLTEVVNSQLVEKNVQFGLDWMEGIDGQVTHESVINLPLGSTRKFGVLANIKIKGAAILCTGNGSAVATRLYKKWDGQRGSYGLYGCGKVGQVTGVYMNGQKLFSVRLIAPPFTSDTTQDVTRRVGQRYTFRVTIPYGGQVPSFTVGNGNLLSTYVAGKVTENKDGSKNYYFGYRCLKKGRTGVYVTLGGKSYCVFSANVR